MILPEAFIQQMAEQLGDELPAFLRTYEEPYCRGIRLNPFKPVEKEALPEGLGERIPWEETGFALGLDSTAGADILHAAGAWYLQEPCAMLPAAVLAAQPGERVLDLCAAPGGKSTQCGLRMKGEGLLVCNEPIRDRARVLSQNIERMGIPNALVVSAYPDELARLWPEAFDAIQVDAPCSGEGMFRRHPETVAEWTAESPAGCAKRQAEILDRAAEMLRPGGRMVYSTCTMNRTENEDTVAAFLTRHGDFALEAFELPGASAPEGLLTCYPHRMKGEGHFVALLRRAGETHGEKTRLPKLDKASAAAIQAARDLGIEANAAVLKASDPRGNEFALYRTPELPGKLPFTLRYGMHLGMLRMPKGRGKTVYTPDHALALSIHPPEAARVDLTEADARRYQAGESLAASGAGWVLACYAGIPLGWGKISDGVMKNHYPKGLRRVLRPED